MDDLEWYLEKYYIWPIGVFQEKAKRIESKFPQWGKSLFDAAMQPFCNHVLEGWNKKDRTFVIDSQFLQLKS